MFLTMEPCLQPHPHAHPLNVFKNKSGLQLTLLFLLSGFCFFGFSFVYKILGWHYICSFLFSVSTLKVLLCSFLAVRASPKDSAVVFVSVSLHMYHFALWLLVFSPHHLLFIFQKRFIWVCVFPTFWHGDMVLSPTKLRLHNYAVGFFNHMNIFNALSLQFCVR